MLLARNASKGEISDPVLWQELLYKQKIFKKQREDTLTSPKYWITQRFIIIIIYKPTNIISTSLSQVFL